MLDAAVAQITFASVCYIALNTGTVFNLSYIGVTATDVVSVRITFNDVPITGEYIIPSGLTRQVFFPYGFVRVVGDGTSLLKLEVKYVYESCQVWAEFAGGPDNET